MSTAFINATILLAAKSLTGKAILIKNDRIESIADPAFLTEAMLKIIDCKGNFISPGLLIFRSPEAADTFFHQILLQKH